MTAYKYLTYTFQREELEASLRRAFVDARADYVVLHSRRQGPFLFAAAELGLREGWLFEQPWHGVDYDQDFELRYRLTDKGREHFSRSKAA